MKRLAVMAPYIAAIAAVTAAVVFAYREYTKYSRAVDEAA